MRAILHHSAAALVLLAATLGLTRIGLAAELPAQFHQTIVIETIDRGLFDAAVRHFSNIARAQNGQPPLKADAKLVRAANDHARNMAKLKSHSHQLPVRGQERLVQRMDRQSLRYRTAGENIAKDKVYRLLGRPISQNSRGCQFVYGDTKQAVPVHTYASLAEQVVARWMASPKHRAALLSPNFGRIGNGVGVDPSASGCGDFYLVQNFAD